MGLIKIVHLKRMSSYECVKRNGDEVFYRKITNDNSCENEAPLVGVALFSNGTCSPSSVKKSIRMD